MEGITDWIEVRQTRIVLPPQPLGALVGGVANDIGQNIQVQGRGTLTPEDSRYGDDPIFAVFRFLDLDFIFQIVLTLFAILFAYDSISGEKERGTLRLTFSNPVSRAGYLCGKLIGSFFGLALPLLIPFVVGALLLPMMGVQLTADEWMRLGMIIGSGFLLFGVFLTLSMLVSTLTHRSAHSFLVLLIAWVFAVIVLPRASVLLTGHAVEVPSAETIASLRGRLSAQLWGEDRRKMANYSPAKGTPMDSMMQGFQKFMGDIADARDKKINTYDTQLQEDRNNKLAVQTKLAVGLAQISPAATFSLAASALAGTSLALKNDYLTQALAYQKAYANFMISKTGMNTGGGMVMRMSQDDGPKPKPINPDELPVFSYVPPKFAAIVPEVSREWGILLLFGLAFFGGSFMAFSKYDLR
jgi:ABC-type transport system involved in multi-copper enzyme maturation permease subunit